LPWEMCRWILGLLESNGLAQKLKAFEGTLNKRLEEGGRGHSGFAGKTIGLGRWDTKLGGKM